MTVRGRARNEKGLVLLRDFCMKVEMLAKAVRHGLRHAKGNRWRPCLCQRETEVLKIYLGHVVSAGWLSRQQ